MQQANAVAVQEVTVPKFLMKLWHLVEDPNFNEYIKWDDAGFSVQIRTPEHFSRNVLPLFFKHNNLNSFIRQLNMYGFHKVSSIESAQATPGGYEFLEFQHPFFVRGHQELLSCIQRKKNTTTDTAAPVSTNLMSCYESLLGEVRSLREKQAHITTKLHEMQKDNDGLYSSVRELRRTHQRQQEVVVKLIRFLLTVLRPNAQKNCDLKRRNVLMIKDTMNECLSTFVGGSDVGPSTNPTGTIQANTSGVLSRDEHVSVADNHIRPTTNKLYCPLNYIQTSPVVPGGKSSGTFSASPLINDVTDEYSVDDASLPSVMQKAIEVLNSESGEDMTTYNAWDVNMDNPMARLDLTGYLEQVQTNLTDIRGQLETNQFNIDAQVLDTVYNFGDK